MGYSLDLELTTAARALVVVRMAKTTLVHRSVVALDHLGNLRLRPPLLEVDRRKSLPAHSVLGNQVGDALGVEEVSLEVEVVDVIADKVVVYVVCDTGLATENPLLLFGLELLCTSEDTTGGDAVLNEGSVIGAVGPDGGDVTLAVVLVELLEVGLDDIGASRAREVESTSIAVVDTVNVVRGGNLNSLVRHSLLKY